MIMAYESCYFVMIILGSSNWRRSSDVKLRSLNDVEKRRKKQADYYWYFLAFYSANMIKRRFLSLDILFFPINYRSLSEWIPILNKSRFCVFFLPCLFNLRRN